MLDASWIESLRLDRGPVAENRLAALLLGRLTLLLALLTRGRVRAALLARFLARNTVHLTAPLEIILGPSGLTAFYGQNKADSARYSSRKITCEGSATGRKRH